MADRISTANRMQLGTRMGTGMRQGTAMREVNYTGVGYNTKVNSVDRPVTNHGMTGMKATNLGPGRQIYDRNYYMNQLKNKNNDIMTEINKMKQEVEDINKDNSTYLNLERKYETLIKDVRKYEGELADYNLALDKHRSDTKPDDIEALYMHIKNQNDKQRSHLDTLFAEKRDMENELTSYEQQIQDIQFANEAKLNDLDPEQRNEYESLKDENHKLGIDINNGRNELDDINGRLNGAENRLKQDTLKQRAQHLREEKASLTKRKGDLELQTNELNLPFPEARERLMNRIKQDNAEIKQQEKELTETRKVIDTYQRNIKEIEGDLKDKKKEGDDMQKYEVLYQKEKEINDFCGNFDDEKANYEKQISDSQKLIQNLLMHMAKVQGRSMALPSGAEMDEKKKMLNHKQKVLNDAGNTAAQLQTEVEQRQGDLEKIKNLEGRLEKEKQQVTEGINKMEDEMVNKFQSAEQLNDGFEDEKQKMAAIKQMVSLYKQGLRNQTNYHSIKHDTKKNQIMQSDTYNRLNDVEKRLIGNESQIYAIQQYIEAKGAESNYQAQFQECMQLCQDINTEVIKKSLAT